MGLLDLLFPKYCINCRKFGDYLCSDCFSLLSFTKDTICLACNRPSFNSLTHPGCKTRYAIDGAFVSISYKGVAKKLLYTFKYRPYVSDLRNLLCELFYEGLIQQEEFHKILTLNPLITPIPLHHSKYKTRGYNQSEILAQDLAKKLGLQTENILLRTKKTVSNYGLKRDERLKNITHAFTLSPNIVLSKYSNIFLVDDILTSGTTLFEAATLLKKAGVKKVFGLALARD